MKSLRSWITGLLIIAVLAGGVMVYRRLVAGKSSSEKLIDGEKVKGPQNAKVTIVEYSDFQCPACRRAEETLVKLLADYPKDVKLIFKNFPLAMHLWSPLAHQAAECSVRQGKFWEYHDKLYQLQEQWSTPQNPTEKFLEYAKISGMNLDSFAKCLSDPSIQQSIEEDKKMALQLQINSTPTFFINGERVVGPVELYVRGEKLIREILGLPAKPAPPMPVQPVPALHSAPETANFTPVSSPQNAPVSSSQTPSQTSQSQ